MNRLRVLIGLALTVFALQCVSAEKVVLAVGVVHEILYKERKLGVGDASISISDDVQIVDVNGKNSSIFNIKADVSIEFEIRKTLSGHREIFFIKIVSKRPLHK